jgi:hypothetical protein
MNRFSDEQRKIAEDIYPRAMAVARDYARRFPRLRDEFISAAGAAVVEIVLEGQPRHVANRTRCRCLNVIRQESRAVSPNEACEWKAQSDSQESRVDSSLDLKVMLGRIGERCSTPVVMHYFEGYTHGDIARILNLGRSQVSGLISQGLRAMNTSKGRLLWL